MIRTNSLRNPMPFGKPLPRKRLSPSQRHPLFDQNFFKLFKQFIIYLGMKAYHRFYAANKVVLCLGQPVSQSSDGGFHCSTSTASSA